MIIDLFAGCGGWSVAARALGLREVGFEWDAAACATRAAAGHATVRCDVASMFLKPMIGKVRALIGSPPCQGMSAAGKREGLNDLLLIHAAMDEMAAGRDPRARLAEDCSDPRSPLVVEPLRYALELNPEWIALEQVPAVLPLWRHMARILRAKGYSVWAGILNAADFGVPQTRQRAILIASRVRIVAPPEPTHAKNPEPDTLFGSGRERWVSMAEALGWTGAPTVNTRGDRKTPGGNEFPAGRPSWALTEKTRSWTVDVGAGGFAQGYERDCDEPSPVIRSQSISWVLRHNARARATVRGLDEPAATLFFGNAGSHATWLPALPKNSVAAEGPMRISLAEASILQTFPADYPWRGVRTKAFEQVGNAIPPLLALHVLCAATGIPVPADAGRALLDTLNQEGN